MANVSLGNFIIFSSGIACKNIKISVIVLCHESQGNILRLKLCSREIMDKLSVNDILFSCLIYLHLSFDKAACHPRKHWNNVRAQHFAFGNQNDVFTNLHAVPFTLYIHLQDGMTSDRRGPTIVIPTYRRNQKLSESHSISGYFSVDISHLCLQITRSRGKLSYFINTECAK